MNKIYIGLFVLFVLFFVFRVFVSRCSAAGRKDGVIFYAGFDGDVNAGKSNGDPCGDVCGDGPYFAKGKRGMALISGDTEGYVSYQIKDNFIKEAGSLEFWVSPIDWTGRDNKFHVFFEAKDPGWFVVYKYYCPGEGVFLTSENRKNWTRSSQDMSGLMPGKWYHFAATWDSREICFYLDGKLSGKTCDPQIPKGFSGKFYVGDRPWEIIQRDNRSLIDELYIYNRVLNENEIKWAYDNALERKPGKDIPWKFSEFIRAGFQILPDKNEIQADFEVTGRTDVKYLIAKAWLEPATGTKEVSARFTNKGICQAVIKYKELPRGDYRLILKVCDREGRELLSETHPIKSPGPAVWLGNKIGISDTPPFPFTAIKTESKDSFSCWGRIYTLGKQGFPSRIISAGKELLQSPIELKVTCCGKTIDWEQGVVEKTEQNKAQIQFRGSAKSSAGVLEWLCTAEYDGLLRYDIELKPLPGVVIEKMELVFRIKPEHAGLYHFIPKDSEHINGGEVPDGNKVFFEDKWRAYWWLGGEERGLCGFCESDQAWDRVDRKDGFYMRRTSDSVDAVWSFIDGSCKVGEPWKFTFGLQATPIKDIKGWRKYRIGRTVTENVNILWSSPSFIRYFGYPEASNFEKYKKLIDECHEKNIMVVPYSCLTYLSQGSPEWFFYGKKWKNVDVFFGSTTADVGAYKEDFAEVCPSQDRIDFIVWANEKYVRELDLDGLYHDMSYVYATNNQACGFGYVCNGEVRQTYPFFMVRQLYKRIYTMLKEYGKEKGKDMFMQGHMSGQMAAPILGFCDSYLDGELFAARVDKNYLEFLPLGYIRSEFMGHNYGVMPYFLPAQPGLNTKVTKEVLGLMLIHDFNMWVTFCDAKEVDRVYSALDEFGYVDADFLPYWKNSDIVKTVSGEENSVKCSIYRKEKGGALLCIANIAEEQQKATFSIEWDRLKSGEPLSVVDAFNPNKEINVNGKDLVVEIEPLGFRILRVK